MTGSDAIAMLVLLSRLPLRGEPTTRVSFGQDCAARRHEDHRQFAGSTPSGAPLAIRFAVQYIQCESDRKWAVQQKTVTGSRVHFANVQSLPEVPTRSGVPRGSPDARSRAAAH